MILGDKIGAGSFAKVYEAECEDGEYVVTNFKMLRDPISSVEWERVSYLVLFETPQHCDALRDNVSRRRSLETASTRDGENGEKLVVSSQGHFTGRTR